MIYEKAYAKINLSLDITGRRPNGYHEVRMIMQTLRMYDELSFEEGLPGSGIVLSTNNETLNSEQESGADNLVVKAAKALFDYKGCIKDVSINLTKNIPIAAGMAGGSSDAAATLRGLNRLFDFNLSYDELRTVAARIGADVAFLVEGGLALCEGIGEIITKLNPLASLPVLICKPRVFVSTKEIYADYDSENREYHPDVDAMLEAIKEYDYKKVCGLMGNVLEPVTKKQHPIITKIVDSIKRAGAVNAMMSGSGPTVFGIFDSDEALYRAFEIIKKEYPDCVVEVTRFYNIPREHFE